MSWDDVCTRFETLHLNWKPDLKPSSAIRHWFVFNCVREDQLKLLRYWPKPEVAGGSQLGEFSS
jgi:hypothetical protein